jgi:phage-related protein (TIGR01555 family)
MFSWFKKTPTPPETLPLAKGISAFSTDLSTNRNADLVAALSQTFRRSAKDDAMNNSGMDASVSSNSDIGYASGNIPDTQIMWYGSQGFIGHQACAMISQHWLVDKACTIPGKDASRKGWEITVNNGTEVSPEVIDAMKAYDVEYKINKNLVEFVKMSRVFGIRIAMFKVQSTDPLYYEKPYNADGIKKGSYQGISQVDPYWCTPILDDSSISDPSAIDFYEPSYWWISGKKIHKSHLIVTRPTEVPDILKPSYLYGGIPLTQRIYERVYAAERTANEAPQLALTKRTNIYKTDAAAALANQSKVEQRLQQQAYYRDNYAVQLIDKEKDDVVQLDTSLADLDSVIMTQYQLVASVANVPATKLLGTSPKGFGASGEYEESNYREELESIQTHDLAPLLQRHYEILLRSNLPKETPFDFTVVFNPIDSPTEMEMADINLKKAQTDQALQATGGIDGTDIRERLIKDSKSGYSGMSNENEIEEEF